MPTPDYIAAIRRAYGQGRLLLPGVSMVVLRLTSSRPKLHLLLTRRSDTGRWSLPRWNRGAIRAAAATAALRELRGDPDHRQSRAALLTTDPDVIYPNGDTCQFVSMCFRCRYVSGRAQVGDESIEVAWFRADEVPDDLSDIQRRRIHCALQDRDDCVFDV